MLAENIYMYSREMMKFKFFKSLLKPIQSEGGKIESMIAYGLGSLSDNLVTQYQFACALALKDELGINGSIEIYDPAMGKEDAAVAAELGCEVVPHNDEAKRVALRRTLFYMPHCGFNLYNGLMWANWGEYMKNVVVVGNRFSSYSTLLGEKGNLHPTNAIYPLLPFIKESPILIDRDEDNVPVADVERPFGNLAVHYLDEEGYTRAEASGLWLRKPHEVIMGEEKTTPTNEEITKYEEELKDNEEHEKELKQIHDKVVFNINNKTSEEEDDLYYCSVDMEDAGAEEPKNDDIDYDDDEFEHIFEGWGSQISNLLKPDTYTPEWSMDPSSVNAYTLGEKDPRERLYVYNDEGVSSASKQMVVHTLRCFCDPSKYIVDTLDSDDVVNKDWEVQAKMLVFPGGADKFYRKKLSSKLGNGGNRRIRAFIENGGNYLGICAGGYYGTRRVEFDVKGPLEVNEERELQLFKGHAVGPALSGFDYASMNGQYAVPFLFNEMTPEGVVSRKGISYYKGGPYFIPDADSVKGKDYIPVLYYAKHPKLTCPPGSLAGICSFLKKGKALLLGAHIEFDPWLMKPMSEDDDDITIQLRDPLLNQGRCRFVCNMLKQLEIDTLPMKFLEPEKQYY